MAVAELSPNFNSLSGRLGNIIYRNTARGTVVANPPVRSEGPATADQAAARRFFGASAKAWTQLSDFERETWHRLAPEVGAVTGQTAYNQASFYRQAAGLELPGMAPMAVPGVGVTRLGIAAPSGADSLRLVLEHGVEDLAGWRVFVQSTRVLASPARQPQPYDFRAVSGLNPASIPPLQASGGVYTLSNLRFALPPGARFGVRVTLISPEGLPAGMVQMVLVQPEAAEGGPRMTRISTDKEPQMTRMGADNVLCVGQSPSAAAGVRGEDEYGGVPMPLGKAAAGGGHPTLEGMERRGRTRSRR